MRLTRRPSPNRRSLSRLSLAGTSNRVSVGVAEATVAVVRRALAGVAALLAAGAAPAAVADRSAASPGTVVGLARSGLSVAFTSGPYAGHCGDRVWLGSLVSRGVKPLGRHPDVV